MSCGYVIWYEDFYLVCSFCGCHDHVIDNCSLLYPSQWEVKVRLLKNRKKKWLAEFLENANGQEKVLTTAEQAQCGGG